MICIEATCKIIEPGKVEIWSDGRIRENICNKTYIISKISNDRYEIRVIPKVKDLDNYIDCLRTLESVCRDDFGFEIIFEEKDNNAE